MTIATILAKLVVRLYLSVWFREHFSFASFMKLFIKLLFRHATAHGLWLPNCPVFTFSMVIPCIYKQLKNTSNADSTASNRASQFKSAPNYAIYEFCLKNDKNLFRCEANTSKP